ncbi:capsid assembly scaffolding protein Gp46 family protein [Bifidobacterium gallicum]|uniref:Putative prophage LambdaCh01, scaffold protein n=1 Tax=Bifidobacterium gallicum DSM 20093 = LMG 11596 TaxID=561180 RepID=D1NSM0_9BIFI|nr:DUF4355 domain-containing protein [Bifidobacterium gallicum]EFA23672.1 hypothetical protein BIFGAL_02778 [Bifidobacterium gallicum DSM 20093 = LMG 11596]KFI58731.1 putative prophage LambdaCh01, scaffold protein [Bifidobacterium gallicum DSM 20093 = LMG 11596]
MFKQYWHAFSKLHNVRTIVEPDLDAGSGSDADAGEPREETREYTQAQIDAIVEKHIGRVRREYADYEDMKTKAARLDEIEAANKTELERTVADLEALQAKYAESQHAMLIQSACVKHGVPAEYAYLVSGANEKAIDMAAQKVAKLASASGPAPRRQHVTEGEHPASSAMRSLDEQIRTAEAKGDWALAGRLKTFKLAQH